MELTRFGGRGLPDESGLLPLTTAERAELTKLRRKALYDVTVSTTHHA